MLSRHHLYDAIIVFKSQCRNLDINSKIEATDKILNRISDFIASSLPKSKYLSFENIDQEHEEKNLHFFEKAGFSYIGGMAHPYVGIISGLYMAKNVYDFNKEKSQKGDEIKYKELEEFTPDLNQFDNCKKALLEIENFINEVYRLCDMKFYSNVIAQKEKISSLKKQLSEHRCSFVSNEVILPKLETSYSLARLYNSQMFSRDEELIKKAFFALSNSGPLIQASNKEVREFFWEKLLPELKKNLSEREFGNYKAMLSLVGDGSTGAEYWLDWKD